MHYVKEGGYYPKGGSEILAKRMVECIYHHGGKVLVKASVDKILVSDAGKAIGVKLQQSGDQIYATEIISTIGILNSYYLLPEQYKDNRFHAIKDQIGHDVFLCTLFLGLKGTSKEN